MNIEQFLSELKHFDADDLQQLKAAIAQREHELQAPPPSGTLEEIIATLRQSIDDFWGDTPADEQQEILDAIRLKNYGKHKDL